MTRLTTALVAALLTVACSSTRHDAAPASDAATASPGSQTEVAVQEAALPDSVSTGEAYDWSLTDPLPVDEKVRVGMLDNGIRYLIRENHRPEERAELRLVVDAGSILEDDDQLGLAHFVEHMAFNGTERFEKQELIDYLESTGTRFGADLNAYTSFDETVYELNVRTDSVEVLDTGLEILREWATRISFDPAEIDKERGVVIEEWRLRRGAQARIADQQLPVLLHGSRYADRLPIGTPEILRSFNHETLIRFYREWYRPELMSVVVVGSIDVDAIESRVRSLFGDIAPVKDARSRSTYDIPDHAETLVASVTDPEAAYSTVSVVYKHDARVRNTAAAYRQSLVENLYHGMFNQRLSELTQVADPPFIAASSGMAGFARSGRFYQLGALALDGELEGALEALLLEAERVRRFGFTESELDRMKQEFLRAYERSYNERDKTESVRFAEEYVRHVLEDEPIPGISYEFELAKLFLPTIALEEINGLGATWITDENRVILADGPEKEGIHFPDELDLKAVFVASAAASVTPYVDDVSDEPLISVAPVPGSIVKEETVEEIGLTRLTLSNGAEVVLKPTDFKNDEILFSAYSPGGTSLVSDADYTSATFADLFVGQGGLGDFGPVELDKKLAGKLVGVGPSIGELSEGLRGSSTPQDIETLFQLVHLYFTAPRVDSAAYLSYKRRLADVIESSRVDPGQAFQDTLLVTMTQYHPRRRPTDERTIEEMDLQRSLAIYRERFRDASDFTFYFVGAFDGQVIRPLIEQYIGSLPGMGTVETWRDVGVRPPSGIVEKELHRGIEPKSSVRMIMTGEATWNDRERRLMGVLDKVLDTKLREVLREDLGGTYGVRVGASLARFPYERYQVSISFGCDPERAAELIQTVRVQIDSLRTFGTTDEYIVKYRETTLNEHKVGLEQNGYWLGSIQYYDQNGLDHTNIPTGLPEFAQSVTTEDFLDAARRYLKLNNAVTVVLYPEDAAESDE